MPLAVYVLGLSVFVLGTSEFMLSGLLPAISGDLGVSIPQAGLLISAFAIGMVVGAPLLGASTLRLPRRTTMILLLTVFATGHVVGGLAGGYGLLFATRVVSALACAGFWAVAAATAVTLAGPDARGRAMAVIVGGLSIANIAGVPAGTFLGEHAGWRSAFFAIAALSAVAVLAVALAVPAGHGTAERPRLRTELRVFAGRRIWIALATTALAQAALFCTFSYLAPLLTGAGGLPAESMPVVLGLFGVGGLVGITIGGRLADRHPFRTLGYGIAAIIAISLAIALGAHQPVLAVALVFAFGVAGFLINPALNARVFGLAEGAPTLAGASSTSAFNIGNTVGPWLGGVVIDAGLGYSSVAVVGAVLAAAAVGTVGVAWAQRERPVAATTRSTARSSA